jgi:hypothetical protein
LLIPKTESFRHLFEVLLVYETWFCLDAVKKSTVVGGTKVSNATKYAMTRYVDTVNHTQGHSLKTTKTDAPLHMDYNLCHFGSNNNSHSGPCESNHIENVKKPSRNMQQQKDTINNRLCKQLSEKLVLDIVTRCCCTNSSKEWNVQLKGTCHRRTSARVTANKEWDSLFALSLRSVRNKALYTADQMIWHSDTLYSRRAITARANTMTTTVHSIVHSND